MAGFNFATAKVAIVTGGGSGIGRALCLGLARRGVLHVVAADIDLDGAEQTARLVRDLGAPGGSSRAARCDASSEESIHRLIDDVEQHEGPVDVFMANAGINKDFGGIDGASNELWQRMMGVNVYQSVFAAKRLLPELATRKGCFVITASAAGLMMQPGSVAYTVTKHAARSLAEWLSVSYGDAGLHVACLCPQAVETNLIAGVDGSDAIAKLSSADGTISAEACCESLFQTLEEGRFLALPHTEVANYVQRKAADVDRWIKGMRRVHQKVVAPVLKAKL